MIAENPKAEQARNGQYVSKKPYQPGIGWTDDGQVPTVEPDIHRDESDVEPQPEADPFEAMRRLGDIVLYGPAGEREGDLDAAAMGVRFAALMCELAHPAFNGLTQRGVAKRVGVSESRFSAVRSETKACVDSLNAQNQRLVRLGE